MSGHGPFHRLGGPGGPDCEISFVPVEGRGADGTVFDGSLLDAGEHASELELLRTIAAGLGVRWGHDELGWWAVVPDAPISRFAAGSAPDAPHVLYREDDNGARFLIGHFESREAAERRAAELAHGAHKQHYFVEPEVPDGTSLA